MVKARWLVVAIPAASVAAYAAAVLLFPSVGAPLVRERLAEMPLAVLGHIAGGSVALFAGAFQINGALRARFLQIHRWLGRVYVVAVLVGGVGGLAMATRSQGGLVTHVGFGLLAALTFAAVMLRIYLPIALVAGIPFIDAYQAIAWACWVPNLLVVEWWLLRPVRAKAAYVAV